MKKSGVSGALRRIVFRESGYRCASCGIVGWEERFKGGGYGYPTLVPGRYLSIDHIVARTNGGSSERDNLRVLCNWCNSAKGARVA